MPPAPDNDTSNIGQDKPLKEAVQKYDQEHGTYKSNVPMEPNLPNASPAAADPSPYKIGS